MAFFFFFFSPPKKKKKKKLPPRLLILLPPFCSILSPLFLPFVSCFFSLFFFYSSSTPLFSLPRFGSPTYPFLLFGSLPFFLLLSPFFSFSLKRRQGLIGPLKKSSKSSSTPLFSLPRFGTSSLPLFLSSSFLPLQFFPIPFLFFPLVLSFPFFTLTEKKLSRSIAKVESPARPAVVMVAESEPNPTLMIC